MKRLRLAFWQCNPTMGDFKGNEALLLEGLERARKNKADMIICPELAITGYPPEDLLLKKHFIDANEKALDRLRMKVGNEVLICGFVDRDNRGRIYNAAAVMSRKRLIGVYRKIHLPNYGVFDEKRYFHEGGKSLILETHEGYRIGLSICEDLWPEDSTSLDHLKRHTVDLLINLSASPYNYGKQRQREGILKRVAKQIKAPVAYVNLVGGQDELVFDGRSRLVSAKGKIISSCKAFGTDFLCLDLPLRQQPREHVANSREVEFKRIPLQLRGTKKTTVQRVASPHVEKEPQGAEEVLCALELGLHDYVWKNGFRKVILGLSGGIDSSLVAAIAVRAIGAENVIGLTMPSRFTSAGTFRDSKKLAQNLKIKCHEIPITGIHAAYLKLLEPIFKKGEENIAEENLQARIRGNLLMAFSNKLGYLVITTGNKSEMATGYCTLYGDMAGGFAVLKDVPKTMVYAVSKHLNRVSRRDVIPASVIRRAPTAELRSDQKDQDTLPPYALLDRILEGYVEKDYSLQAIEKKGFSGGVVRDVIRRVDGNEYKRRQGPVGIKITPKAFGRDRRVPITNRFGS